MRSSSIPNQTIHNDIIREAFQTKRGGGLQQFKKSQLLVGKGTNKRKQKNGWGGGVGKIRFLNVCTKHGITSSVNCGLWEHGPANGFEEYLVFHKFVVQCSLPPDYVYHNK